jgi:hypothetical protein
VAVGYSPYKNYNRKSNKQNITVKKIETQMCSSAGTEKRQDGLEVCSVCGVFKSVFKNEKL